MIFFGGPTTWIKVGKASGMHTGHRQEKKVRTLTNFDLGALRVPCRPQARAPNSSCTLVGWQTSEQLQKISIPLEIATVHHDSSRSVKVRSPNNCLKHPTFVCPPSTNWCKIDYALIWWENKHQKDFHNLTSELPSSEHGQFSLDGPTWLCSLDGSSELELWKKSWCIFCLNVGTLGCHKSALSTLFHFDEEDLLTS